MVHMGGYRCKDKCRFEEPMEYNTRHAYAWCTVCRVSWVKEPVSDIRCYCCGNILATKKGSSSARRKRSLTMTRY